MFGPALALMAASFTGDSAPLTVGLLSLGVGLMGGTMSGYRINHLDIAPRFAGILMSLTNCVANIFALLAPVIAGYIVEGKVGSPLDTRAFATARLPTHTFSSSNKVLMILAFCCSRLKLRGEWYFSSVRACT